MHQIHTQILMRLRIMVHNVTMIHFQMAVFVVGVVGIVLFYLIILGLGLWAARRRKDGDEEAMLAGRKYWHVCRHVHNDG